MSREAKPSYEFGPFRLDPSEHGLRRNGRPVALTPKIFDVLHVLVQNAGHLVEKDALLKEVWPDSFVEEGTLSRSVSVLRKALGETAVGPTYIETVPKRGYRFVAPVTCCLPEGSSSVIERDRHAGVDRGATHTDSRQRPPASPLPAHRAGMSKLAAGIATALLTLSALSYAVLRPAGSLKTAPTPLAPAHRQVTFTGKEGAPTLSPDGRRIAYVSDDGPERKLMVQELAGGPPLAVFSAPEVGHVRWSPDGSELLLWTRGAGQDGIYIMPQLGGTLRRVAGGQYIACWSPDGSTIAVASYLVGKIWLLDTRGHEQRTIALQGVHWSIWDIDWSPANGLLTFASNDYQGRYTVWTIQPDGSEQTEVIAEDAEICAVRWAPHGEAIYYFRRLNQTVSLYKISVPAGREDRAAVTTTLLTGLETDGSFALSADGRQLVYARAPYHSNLWMLQANGPGESQTTAVKELTRGTSLIERPSISPDGRSVVFNIGHEGLSNLYTMPTTGGTSKQLTFLDSFNIGGVWSADGQSIAFASTQGGRPRVWTVNASGGTPRALSSDNLSDSFDLAWAPGDEILYQETGNRNYYVLDPATGAERLFVRDSLVGWMFSPVYSPDGRQIAAQWSGRPNRGIWVIDREDRRETIVYRTSAASTMPIGWSQDGTSIYALEGTNAKYRGLTAPLGETVTDAKILRVPANGGKVMTVASLPFEEIGSVSMTPDGRVFVFTVYSSRSDVWVVNDFDVPPGPSPARTP